MKKSLIAFIATSAIALASSSVFAQASNFQGFSAGANVNFATTSTEVVNNKSVYKINEASQNASLQAAYGIGLSNSAVLGFGGTYSLGDLKAGSGSASNGAMTVALKTKNLYSLYLEPGFVVGNTSLAYAKLMYLGTKGERTSSFGPRSTTSSEHFKGMGFGAGFRTMLNKNLYLQAEFLQTNFGSKNIHGIDIKISGTTGTVGLGYKF
jgi:opacity protein-like surface antigen